MGAVSTVIETAKERKRGKFQDYWRRIEKSVSQRMDKMKTVFIARFFLISITIHDNHQSSQSLKEHRQRSSFQIQNYFPAAQINPWARRLINTGSPKVASEWP
jgi:hypothetical protein